MRDKAEPLPWSQIMAFGFGRLGLSPDAFWSMSLREMNAAIRWHLPHLGSTPGMNRTGLADLMKQFPDQMHGGSDGH
ncbi:MAG: phage tail assembly chaperone [Ahrensia sp.]